MDKTAKLIQWHRLAILWLVIVTITTALMLQNEQQLRARAWVSLQRAAQGIDQRDERHKDDQRIIRDLDARLRQYKSKYGEIQQADTQPATGKVYLNMTSLCAAPSK